MKWKQLNSCGQEIASSDRGLTATMLSEERMIEKPLHFSFALNESWRVLKVLRPLKTDV